MALTEEEIEELSQIIDERTDTFTLAQRREWLTANRPIKIRKRRKKGPPTLSIVKVAPRLPAPPGFEQYAVSRLRLWDSVENEEEFKKLKKRLWNIWLHFLGQHCPFRDSDPEWSYRYEDPNVDELAERIPGLVAQHRRRFGTAYCRLVRQNGQAVS
jgi:hypothetical protein